MGSADVSTAPVFPWQEMEEKLPWFHGPRDGVCRITPMRWWGRCLKTAACAPLAAGDRSTGHHRLLAARRNPLQHLLEHYQAPFSFNPFSPLSLSPPTDPDPSKDAP